MDSPDHDTLVIGAGPAGTACGIELARSGRDVAIVDRAEFPRDKCCGDGLTSLALRRLEALGLRPDDVASWTPVERARVRTPGGRVLDLPMPTDGWYSAVARRSDLDAALVHLARDRGVPVHESARVVAVETDDDGATVGLADGRRLRARHLVAADGAWSPTRKLLGIAEEGYRGEFQALRQYLRVDGPESRRQWVWFEPDLLPGYAWSFPLPDGGVNLGIAIHREERLDGGEVKEIMAGLAHRPAIAEVLGAVLQVDPVRAWPIPARLPRSALAHGPVLFVGDAARACDPLTGEGIGQALTTGMLAAEAIASGSAPALAAERYADAAHAHLDADDRVARWCTAALSSPRRAEVSLRTAGLTGWTRRNVARWMFEDEPRAIALTPRRWHRRLFRQRGAYAR
ncbi:MAG: NAD(P)/FAD-dependent oxidoreductase [Actinomycetota bacterium]